MTEIWVIQIIENMAKNRQAVSEALIDWFDKEGIPAEIKAIFRVGEHNIELEALR